MDRRVNKFQPINSLTHIPIHIMKQFVTCIFILTVLTSCKLSRQTESTAQQDYFDINKDDGITLFFTGYELGALKPCGCSGGQLGGLSRRSAIFNNVPKNQRMIIDIGTLVEKSSEQDRIKFDILFRAMNLIGYDMLCLSEKDTQIIEEYFGSVEYFEPTFKVIAPEALSKLQIPAKFSKTLQLEGKNIDINILAVDVDSIKTDQIGKLLTNTQSRPNSYSVNILVANRRDSDFLEAIKSGTVPVDCVILPSVSDQPVLISEPDQKPVIFSSGRFGRYIAKIKIKPAEKTGLKINFDSQAVADLPEDIYLINLYKDYQQIVTNSNLVENFPRYVDSNDLRYRGTDSCSSEKCHAFAFIEWMKSAHSNAYETLEKVGSQYDPECAICHVVGMEYKSGFITEKKSPLLMNVGCENCHGPGSAHNADPHKVKMPIPEPNAVCIKCHTTEHSNDYAGHEKEKLALIKHWVEPNQPAIVK
jgi:hypothetical protein